VQDRGTDAAEKAMHQAGRHLVHGRPVEPSTERARWRPVRPWFQKFHVG
jgi:hypothetical protein